MLCRKPLRVPRPMEGSDSPSSPSSPSLTCWKGADWGSTSSSSLGSSSKIHFLPEVQLRSISQCRQQLDEPSFLSFQWKICFSKLSISTQKTSDLWKGHFFTENPSAGEFPNQLFFWNLLPHRLKITQTWWLSSHVTKANVLLESLVTAEVCCFC